MTQTVPFFLQEKNEDYPARVITGDLRIEDDGEGLTLFFEGYGTKDSAPGHGRPVYIELYEGKLKVYLWPDINEEDPLVIDMEAALEANYRASKDD